SLYFGRTSPVLRMPIFGIRTHVSHCSARRHSDGGHSSPIVSRVALRADTEPMEGIEPSFRVYETRGLPLTYLGIAGCGLARPHWSPGLSLFPRAFSDLQNEEGRVSFEPGLREVACWVFF